MTAVPFPAGHGAEAGGSNPGSLPKVDELYLRYDEFRRQYFDGLVPESPRVTIEWSSRLTAAAGRCYTKQRIIRLSTHYHLKHPDEVDKTLLHEMIHLLVPNHGPDFYAWMECIRRRGGSVTRYAKERATTPVYRWHYACGRGCGMEAWRQRRLARGGVNHRCKRCGGTLRETRRSKPDPGDGTRN